MIYVSDLMTEDVFTLKMRDTLKTARSMMNLARIRHVPIVDGQDRFIGLVTHRDLLKATISSLAGVDRVVQDEIDAGIPVSEIMRTDVTTVAPDTTLREAAQLLLQHKYGCLPVVSSGRRLVGIITEADFLRLAISLMAAMDDGVLDFPDYPDGE
ncbi:MAG: CBS domain-containing protein [Desulfovibrionaceae bacterium]|jgi:CBS domain-containing membrane protein|nr:CBS domain-containing protein [Desulfovibrionaceae bacterium]